MPTLVNTIDSKGLYAARAVADAAGNDIAQTYATKAELPTQVQADWAQSVASAPDFIKNRPLSRLVPASTVYDQDMVLTVDASGNAGWGGAYILVAVSMMGPSDTIAQEMLDCWNYKQVVLQDPTYGKNLPLISITYDGHGYDLHNRIFNAGGVYDGKLYSISVFWNSDAGYWSWTSTETLVPDELTAGSGVEIVSNVVNAKVDGTTVTFDANGCLTATGGGSTYTAGNGIDITSYVISVDTSVVATQADLAGKEDDFDAGSGLEFTTDGQGNRVLQVEAPVDIVAGPGIVIDNPDGNTLRVSTDEDYEVELWSGTAATSVTCSEAITNFERLKVYITPAAVTTDTMIQIVEMIPGKFGTYMMLAGYASNLFHIYGGRIASSGGTILKTENGFHMWVPITSGGNVGNEASNSKIVKVVGVHRIANN